MYQVVVLVKVLILHERFIKYCTSMILHSIFIKRSVLLVPLICSLLQYMRLMEFAYARVLFWVLLNRLRFLFHFWQLLINNLSLVLI
jgi:hypothetical protein